MKNVFSEHFIVEDRTHSRSNSKITYIRKHDVTPSVPTREVNKHSGVIFNYLSMLVIHIHSSETYVYKSLKRLCDLISISICVTKKRHTEKLMYRKNRRRIQNWKRLNNYNSIKINAWDQNWRQVCTWAIRLRPPDRIRNTLSPDTIKAFWLSILINKWKLIPLSSLTFNHPLPHLPPSPVISP